MQAAPYIDTADDYLANACSFGLVLVLQVCIIFKLGTLVEIRQVWERMGHEQQTAFEVPVDTLAVVLSLGVIGALVLSFLLLFVQLCAWAPALQLGCNDSRCVPCCCPSPPSEPPLSCVL